jgi:hypothetical protein
MSQQAAALLLPSLLSAESWHMAMMTVCHSMTL